MNNLKMGGLRLKGVGYIQRKGDLDMANPMEQFIEDDDKNDAMVEQVINENEAVPAAEPVIEKYDIGDVIEDENEGGVELSSVPVEDVPPLELKVSDKPGFNPNTITNGIRDEDENEGGVIANKMAIPQDAEGSQLIPPGSYKGDIDARDKYEVTGFSIQYRPSDEHSKGIVSEDVLDYYDSLTDAQSRFDGNIYKKPNGIESMISRGGPVICFNDRQVMEFINHGWRKS